MNWWLIAIKKYAEFSGRARRTEYWMFYLFSVIFSIVAIILDIVLGTVLEELGIVGVFGIVYSLFALAIFLPSLAVTVRRLHDVGKSGWWFFISFVPFIGGLWFFILSVTDSQANENEYGANPKLI